jgi:hypothetical protein
MSGAGDETETAAWLDAVSRVIDLPIPDAYRDGVLLNLRVIAAHVERLGDFALGDHTEPAPVYRP